MAGLGGGEIDPDLSILLVGLNPGRTLERSKFNSILEFFSTLTTSLPRP